MAIYEKDKDYMALMQDSVSKGDYKSAANYESLRNQKIQGEGLDYEQTNQYAKYLEGSGTQGAMPGIPEAVLEGAKSEQLKTQTNKNSALAFLQRPEYKSQYSGQIGQLINEMLGMGPFQYTPEKDIAFQQYKKLYTQEGNRAAEDTIGKVAGRTGGMMSSYGASAAAQQQQYYAQQITAKLPELEQMAYERYMNELKMKQGNLSILQGAEQDDYNRFLDANRNFENDRNFAQDIYTDERNFNYDMGRDEVYDAQKDREYERAIGLDAYEQEQDTKMFDYNKTKDERDFDYGKTIDDREYNLKKDSVEDERTLAWAKYYESINGTSAAENGTNGTDDGTEQVDSTPGAEWDTVTAQEKLMNSGIKNARSQQDVYNFVTSWLIQNAANLSDEAFAAISDKYSMDSKPTTVVNKEEKDKN